MLLFFSGELIEVDTTGRKLINHTVAVLKKNGYDCIYGDTDSVYVKANSTGLFDILAEGKLIRETINNSYVDFAKQFNSDDCTLEIEFEKVFKKALFVSKKDSDVGAKKKYAYIPLWIDGKTVKDKTKVEVTGFGTVRSDLPRIARVIQRNILEMILREEGKEKVVEYLVEMEKKVRRREIPDDEFAFPKGISNNLADYGKSTEKESASNSLSSFFYIEQQTEKKKGIPPVIKGCIYSNKYLGTQFDMGSKPKWVYIKKVPQGYPSTEVLSFEEKIPEGFIPDYDIMCEKIFKNNIESAYIAAGFGEFPNLNSSLITLNKWGV